MNDDDKSGWFRNIKINLTATDTAATVCVWCLCMAALGIWGGEQSALIAVLTGFGGVCVIVALLLRTSGGPE